MTTAETDQTKKRNGADWRSVDIVFADGSTGPAKAAYSGDGWCDVAVERGGIFYRLWVRANGEVDLPMNPCRLAKPWTAIGAVSEASGAPETESKAVAEADPLVGLPEEERARILDIADKAGRMFGLDAERMAIAREVAAYCARQSSTCCAWHKSGGRKGEPCARHVATVAELAATPEPLTREETEADPLAGLPEAKRTRILREAGLADGPFSRQRAIAAGIAAFCARRVPEMLNREEAEKRLRALGVGEKTISEDLDNPRDVIVCYDPASVAPKYAAEVASRVAVLRAHVRWLDAQRDASPSPRRPVATNAETGPLATVPANERARIIAVAQKASRDNPFDCDRAYRDVVAREVAAWHARPPCVPCSGKGGLPGRWKCGVCGGTGRTIPAFDGVPGANPYGGKRPPASVRIEYDHGPDGETYRIEVPATPVPIGIARRGAPERVTDDELSAYAGQPGNISKADGPELAARLAAEVVALRAEHNAAHVRLDKAGALTHMIGTGTDEDQRATLTERIHDLATTAQGARPVPLTPEQLRAIADDLAEAGDSRTVLVNAATVRALLGARPVPIVDTSPEARAEGAWLAWDGALPGAQLFAWDDFHPAAKTAWDAVVNYCDASRPILSDAWKALSGVIAALAKDDSLVDDAIVAAERTGCPTDTVYHLHEINDALFRRRLRNGRTSRGETGPDAERGPSPGLTEEQAADLRERAACVAETCSGGDHIISKRDLIAQRIRELPLRAARAVVAGSDPCPDGKCTHSRGEHAGITGELGCGVIGCPCMSEENPCRAKDDAALNLLRRALPWIAPGVPEIANPATEAQPAATIGQLRADITAILRAARNESNGLVAQTGGAPAMSDERAAKFGAFLADAMLAGNVVPLASEASPIETRRDPIGLGESFPSSDEGRE